MGTKLVIPCVLEEYEPDYQTSRFFVKPSHKIHFPLFSCHYHANLNAFPRLKRLTNSNQGVEDFDFDADRWLGRTLYALVDEESIAETDEGTKVRRVENFAANKNDDILIRATSVAETEYVN